MKNRVKEFVKENAKVIKRVGLGLLVIVVGGVAVAIAKRNDEDELMIELPTSTEPAVDVSYEPVDSTEE